MKRIIIMFFLIVIGFVFQTSFIVFFDYLDVIPNISMILLVIFAMLSDGVTGGILGLITGILYDVMVYDIFGLYTLIYFIIGATIGAFSDDMLRENRLVYIVVTSVSNVVMNLLLYLILFFLKFRVQFAANILPNILFETVINAVIVVFVQKMVIYLFNKFNVKA